MARYSATEIIARLEAGEDPTRLVALNVSDDLQAALHHAAPLRWLDAELWSELVQPKSASASSLEDLVARGVAQSLPLEPGRHVLAEETRRAYLDEWDPDGLRRYSAELAEVFRRKGDLGEALYHLMPADQAAATELFERLFADADAAFDLRTAKELLDLFERPDRRQLVGSDLRRLLDRRRAYVNTRSSWAGDYYRSAGFLERPRYTDVLRALLREPSPRVLQLVAMGGMGKTMLLRWFAARCCIPAGIATARIDFDEVEPAVATRHPWLVLLALANQLNEQMPERPFQELLDEHARLLPALYRGTGRETSAAVLELGSVADDPALAAEIVQRYRFAMSSRSGAAEPLVLVFDTLETPLLPEDLDIGPLLTAVVDVHAADPQARLVLSGRYELATRADLRPTLDALDMHTVHIEQFTEEEGRAYLADVRRIGRPDLVEAILANGDLLPFTLALYADLAVQDANLTAADVEAFEDPQQLYLIERVLERIDDTAVRFLLRYGVVPRQLSKRFVAEVMHPYLSAALAAAPLGDDPAQADHPRMAAAFRVDESATGLDVDAVWRRLVTHAASRAWVSFVEGLGGEYVSFHPNVREPMRLVLEGQAVLRQLHAGAANYFRTLMAEEPHRRMRWAGEVAYHLFQAHGPAAAPEWRALLDEAHRTAGTPARAELAAAVTADPDLTVAGGTEPARWFGGKKVMSAATLADSHLEVALARVAADTTDGPGVWPEAERRLATVATMEHRAGASLVDPARRSAVELVLRARAGDTAVLDRIVDDLRATDDPLLLEMFLRVVLGYAGLLGSARLRRVEEHLAARAGSVDAAQLSGLRAVLVSLLLLEGNVAAAWSEVGDVAGAGEDGPHARLPALVELARGASAEAAMMLGRLTPNAEAVELEGTAWVAAGLPERALEAASRLGDTSAPVGERSVHLESTRGAAEVAVAGRVAAARGDVREAVRLMETAALRCREAGDLVREAERWATAAEILLDAGRVGDAGSPLEAATKATVPTGHPVWLTARLNVVRWLDRRTGDPDAVAALDEVVAELGTTSGVGVLARAGVEGLALSSSPDPARYLAMVERAVASFDPPDAALSVLAGLARCRPLGAGVPLAPLSPLRRLLEDGESSSLPDPYDEANRLVRLADVARVVGERKIAVRVLARAAAADVAPDSLVPLRVLQAAARLGAPIDGADDLVERFTGPQRHRPALVVDALVAWARLGDDWHWVERAREMVQLLEQVETPTSRNADVLLLCAEAARAGRFPGDADALLDAARRLYDELGDERAAARLAPATTAAPPGPGERAVADVALDEGPGDTVVVTGADVVSLPLPLLDPAASRGDRTTLVSRLAEDGAGVAHELRAVLGSLPGAGAGGLRLRIRSPRLSELPWELAIPPNGPVLFRANRDPRPRMRHLQLALMERGHPCVADGVAGPQTTAALAAFQRQAGLVATGEADPATLRALWATAPARRSVLVVQRSHDVAVQKARTRGRPDELESLYRRREMAVVTVEDPTFDVLARVDSRAAVVHVRAELEPLRSGAGLSFGRTMSRSASEYGVESLTVTAIDQLVSRVGTGLGPVVVVEALPPFGTWEQGRQLLLRNLFASQLFELGSTPALLALGPLSDDQPPDLAERVVHALSGQAEQADDLAGLWRWLRHDADPRGSRSVASAAAVALFAEDPAAVGLRT